MVIDDFISKIVFLDTAPLIYFVEENNEYSAQLERIFRLNDSGKISFITTTITLLEVLVKPLKKKELDLALRYQNALTQSIGIKIIDVSKQVAVEAARLRSEYKLKTPDSIQLATAILFDVDYFLTNDKGLKAYSELPIVTLDELEV